MKKRVGITGMSGFVGSFIKLKLQVQDRYDILAFEDEYFDDEERFQRWVNDCDVIVHLAAINRTDGDQELIYETNIRLVRRLIAALRNHPGEPHVLFASSIQEENNSPYGRSKREGRKLLEEWARETGHHFSGLVIPNVYGPFGLPFYNSVVATFCHQLTHGEAPRIDRDADILFIHVWELAEAVLMQIENKQEDMEVRISETFRMSVSTLLGRLEHFHDVYHREGRIPELDGIVEINLFNTLRSFYKTEQFPIYPERREDARGHLVELVKTGTGGQVFFSVTKPGITRGNHFHTRKIERFCVVEGEAVIRLRRMGTSEVIEHQVSGSSPGFVDMPVFCTHSITNIGTDDLITLFWTNEVFDPSDPDTYFAPVLEESS